MTEEVRPGGATRFARLQIAALALIAAVAAADGGSEPIPARSAVGAPAMVAARILSGQEGGTLPLSVVALFDRQPTGESVVPILVHVDGPALLESSADSPRLALGVFVYALTPAGKVAATLSEVVQIGIEERRQCLEQGGLGFVGALRLQPGEYSLRVLVRGARGADTGLRVVELDLPPAGDRRRAMLPPLFRSRSAGCLALQQAVAEGRIQVPLLDVMEPPAARLSLGAGARAEFELLVNGADAGETPLVLELHDASQRVAATLPVEILERLPATGGWEERLTAAVDPGDLEPGTYRLRARWGAPPAEPMLSAWLDVDLVGGAPARAMPAARAAPSGDRRETSAAVSQAYRQALALLSKGDWLAAQTALVELERGALGEEILDELAALAAAEDVVVQELAESGASGLVPVYVLHRNLHNRYRAETRFLLARHARSRAERAIDLFIDSATWLTGRELAADLLANLAGDLQRVGTLKLSQDLFQRALASFPRHQGALLGLAADLEKRADYTEAVELLETLVEAQPDDAHAALRLAVNLRRLERDREAGKLLEELVGAESPAWVHSLACQELGSLRLERSDAAAAESVLRQCLERSPADEKLLLQLAFVVSAAGRPVEARQLLARQSFRASARQTASPRYRYSLWPSEALAAARDRVRDKAQAELPVLAAALGAAAGEAAP